MASRYFTLPSGAFKDGVRAIGFDDNGYSWYVLLDGSTAKMRQVLFELQHALNNVAIEKFVEVSEDYAHNRLVDTPATVEGAW